MKIAVSPGMSEFEQQLILRSADYLATDPEFCARNRDRPFLCHSKTKQVLTVAQFRTGAALLRDM